MIIRTQNIVIRAFERKDACNLYRIVREENIMRFMPDWAEGRSSPQDYYSYMDEQQSKKDSIDVYKNQGYVIALSDTDEMIGMTGTGLEDTLNEVEVAYFMSEKYQRRGYTKEAVDALVEWCFAVSEIPYLILTIDIANKPSYQLALKCGFELFEQRTPIGHKQPNMESDSYFYFRKYRK